MIQDCLVCNFSLLLGCCLFVSQIYFSNGQTACTITLTTFLSRISQHIFSSTIEKFGEANCQSVSFRQDF